MYTNRRPRYVLRTSDLQYVPARQRCACRRVRGLCIPAKAAFLIPRATHLLGAWHCRNARLEVRTLAEHQQLVYANP